MKQCPECNETFDDQKAFCDMDGSALIDQTDSLRAALNQANMASSSGNASAWMTGAIGGLIGVIICVLLYLLFLVPGQKSDLEQERRANESKETRPVTPSQVALVPTTNQVHPTESPSPTETASPAEAASPAPAAPAAATPPPAALNNGPIATGTTRELAGGDRAIIKMKDGSTVEADAAWEDSQGIWFRRSGLVSFVEKSRVEAITEPQRKPAAEAKTP
jgi:type IV secretory pathway VirB10-like protein